MEFKTQIAIDACAMHRALPSVPAARGYGYLRVESINAYAALSCPRPGVRAAANHHSRVIFRSDNTSTPFLQTTYIESYVCAYIQMHVYTLCVYLCMYEDVWSSLHIRASVCAGLRCYVQGSSDYTCVFTHIHTLSNPCIYTHAHTHAPVFAEEVRRDICPHKGGEVGAVWNVLSYTLAHAGYTPPQLCAGDVMGAQHTQVMLRQVIAACKCMRVYVHVYMHERGCTCMRVFRALTKFMSSVEVTVCMRACAECKVCLFSYIYKLVFYTYVSSHLL